MLAIETGADLAVWIAFFYCAGFALVFLELFIPGWIAGTAGLASIGVALVMAWHTSLWLTVLLGVGAAAGLPAMLVWGVNRAALKKGLSSADGFVASNGADLSGLVGKSGLAATVLRPSGAVEVGGGRFDARAEKGFIERGEAVEVLRVESGELIVRRSGA